MLLVLAAALAGVASAAIPSGPSYTWTTNRFHSPSVAGAFTPSGNAVVTFAAGSLPASTVLDFKCEYIRGNKGNISQDGAVTTAPDGSLTATAPITQIFGSVGPPTATKKATLECWVSDVAHPQTEDTPIPLLDGSGYTARIYGKVKAI